MRSIGRIIAENRKKKGLSQPKLAELLSQQGIDVTAKAISKWETDAREPGLHEIGRASCRERVSMFV